MSILRLGTHGFSHQDWIDNFYPPHTPPESFLTHYAQHFRAVEIDELPAKPAALKAWHENTPPDFIFCVKFPRSITHAKQLINAEAETEQFFKALQPLRKKCGPLLLQFKPDFSPKSAENLDRYLAQLPKAFRYAIEFRHKDWWQDQYFDLLKQHRVAFCLHDLHYAPKITRLTTDFTYIRWLGNRRRLKHFDRIQIDRATELTWWSNLAKEMLRRGTHVYGFFNNYWAGHAPSSAKMFLKMLIEE